KALAPALEAALDGLVGMEAVDVQEVDAAVEEIGLRLVEHAPQQPGQFTILSVVVVSHRGERAVIIKHGVAPGSPGLLGADGLAAGEKRGSKMRSELHKLGGPVRVDQPPVEGNALGPRRWQPEPVGLEQQHRAGSAAAEARQYECAFTARTVGNGSHTFFQLWFLLKIFGVVAIATHPKRPPPTHRACLASALNQPNRVSLRRPCLPSAGTHAAGCC